MDRNTLFQFIQRIVRSGNLRQSQLALTQLAEILGRNGEMQHHQLVLSALEAIPELRELPPEPPLDERAILIAQERARDRLRREEEARRNGRC